MNYHSHERRDEVWTVVSGSGQVVVDGVSRGVSAGDVIDLPVGCKHTVIASEEGLHFGNVRALSSIRSGSVVKGQYAGCADMLVISRMLV